MAECHHCAVCAKTNPLHGIIVGKVELFLCVTHRDKLGARTPKSFDELAAMLGAVNVERGADRRRGERRMFPRPERRRHNDGRRADDL